MRRLSDSVPTWCVRVVNCSALSIYQLIKSVAHLEILHASFLELFSHVFVSPAFTNLFLTTYLPPLSLLDVVFKHSLRVFPFYYAQLLSDESKGTRYNLRNVLVVCMFTPVHLHELVDVHGCVGFLNSGAFYGTRRCPTDLEIHFYKSLFANVRSTKKLIMNKSYFNFLPDGQWFRKHHQTSW